MITVVQSKDTIKTIKSVNYSVLRNKIYMCTKRGGIGVVIWELPNEKGRHVIHHFKDLSVPIILEEKLLNNFGFCLQGASELFEMAIFILFFLY